MAKKVRLTVLEGGRYKQVTVNALLLKIAPDTLSPLPADVRVFEEDTHLVLTVDPVMRYTEEHPVQLMTRIMESKPNAPGSIVTNKRSWYAVVHDLDGDPTWKREWIEKAYRQVLTLAEARRVERIGLPLLGSVHGNFAAGESLQILFAVINMISFTFLKKALVLVPPDNCTPIWHRLQEIINIKEL